MPRRFSRQPGAAALGVEIVLIPVAMLLLGRRRLRRARDVVHVVAAAGDEPAHAFRPQRRDDAGGAPAPVIAAQDRIGDTERIHHLLQVVAERRLLARAHGVVRKEPCRTVAAQVRHDHAASGQQRQHFVEGARVVGKAVQQDHRRALAAFLVGDVERRGADVLDGSGHDVLRSTLLLWHPVTAGRTHVSTPETLRLGPRGRGPERRRGGLRARARAGSLRRDARGKRKRAAARGDHARGTTRHRTGRRSHSAPATTTTAPRTRSASPIRISRAALRATTRARRMSSPIRATRRKSPPCSTGPAAPTRR